MAAAAWQSGSWTRSPDNPNNPASMAAVYKGKPRRLKPGFRPIVTLSGKPDLDRALGEGNEEIPRDLSCDHVCAGRARRHLARRRRQGLFPIASRPSDAA